MTATYASLPLDRLRLLPRVGVSAVHQPAVRRDAHH